VPYAAPTPCNHPGCPALVHGGYCTKHEQQHRRLADRSTDQNRQSASRRGYDRIWRRNRRYYLSKHPICEDERGCDRAATEVHHRVPIADGGTNEVDNLQALCKGCHSRKTRHG
jgi:5-methylcytosine-specific restriction protein A